MANITREPKQATEVDKAVGAHIRMARRRSGLTQKDLAERLNLSFQQVQKYEKGMNRVAAGTLADIAAVLDVPIQSFFPDEARDHGGDRLSFTTMVELKAECRRLVNGFKDRDQLEAAHIVLRTLGARGD
ncbi:MAG: helix-turn-helix transcriptional regulator [Pseudomonadota bacterium]